MEKKTIIGIGEILWDILPEGKQLGGAPANFAWHCQQLGARGAVISAVGNDSNGKEIMDFIEKKEIINGISITDKPTGTVEVKLVDGIPEYVIHEDVAWDFIQLNETGKEVLNQADAICFGSLAQRNEVSRDSIIRALEMTPDSCLKIFDINLRQNYYSRDVISSSLKHADVFKINEEELEEVKKLFGFNGSKHSVAKSMLDFFDLQLLAITGGELGSLLLSENDTSEMKTPKVEVADTIGAGDSFTAALAMGILNEYPLQQIHSNAVEISAFVCTRNGAMPVLPETIVKRINK
ncbi:carbohydrate kinase family protein [Anaerophaga thermohalophila]|uniref:carbohydrate kinase family protein n=1 Tax=Anaerophaga thermohalophila TaxID=177400 RepID=UPI000237D357|nr:carbohydrate kinase [Anaerophaga thermohalophila]